MYFQLNYLKYYEKQRFVQVQREAPGVSQSVPRSHPVCKTARVAGPEQFGERSLQYAFE